VRPARSSGARSLQVDRRGDQLAVADVSFLKATAGSMDHVIPAGIDLARYR
jgi:hypothetical protein